MPLTFPHKKNKQKAIPWRPNLVNSEKLPDTKVIRTGFILNFIAIAVAVILGSYVLILEYKLFSLAQSGAELQSHLNAGTPENRRNLQLSGQFNQISQKMEQVVQFDKLPFEVHQLVVDLIGLKPEIVTYQSITLQPTVVRQGRREISRHQVILIGRVQDFPDRPAAQTIAGLQRSMATLKAFEGTFQEAVLQTFLRTGDSSDFQFNIVVTLDLGTNS